jgi:hypothetical protein
MDRILTDNARVFTNEDHFATWHTWNGRRFLCVTDEETALKRKNNNVVDLSWDNDTTETVLNVEKSQFPGRAIPNEHGLFDRKPMKILQVQEDIGMYTILLVSQNPKPMAES